jgi:fumarate hydratase class I
MAELVTIKEQDLIDSVADALQFISYYHPMDYIRALGDAYEAEQGPAAKDAIAQILTNSRMCAEGHRPICQDTGIVNVFIKWGQNCILESEMSLQRLSMKACAAPITTLTTSCAPRCWRTRLHPPQHARQHALRAACRYGQGQDPRRCRGQGRRVRKQVQVQDDEPVRSIVDWVLEMLPQMGAGWCPPGMLGIGIGGTAEHCVLLAKKALMEQIDMAQLKQRGPQNDLEALRIEIFDKVNALGIGAQGLGGLATILDVKIMDAPATRRASRSP